MLHCLTIQTLTLLLSVLGEESGEADREDGCVEKRVLDGLHRQQGDEGGVEVKFYASWQRTVPPHRPKDELTKEWKVFKSLRFMIRGI